MRFKASREHKVLLNKLVYVAVCGSMLSITAELKRLDFKTVLRHVQRSFSLWRFGSITGAWTPPSHISTILQKTFPEFSINLSGLNSSTGGVLTWQVSGDGWSQYVKQSRMTGPVTTMLSLFFSAYMVQLKVTCVLMQTGTSGRSSFTLEKNIISTLCWSKGSDHNRVTHKRTHANVDFGNYQQ